MQSTTTSNATDWAPGEIVTARRHKNGFAYRHIPSGQFLCCKSYNGFAGWELTPNVSNAAILKQWPDLAGDEGDYEAIAATEVKEIMLYLTE